MVHPRHEIHGVRIFHGDARKILHRLEGGYHLTITSPPYNVGIAYDEHVDNMPKREYQDMLLQVFADAYTLTVPGGRIAVVVPLGVGRNPWELFASEVTKILQLAGWEIRGWIIWNKSTTGNRTTWGSFRLPTNPALRDTVEVIIVGHKETPRLEIPQEFVLRDHKGLFSPWLQDSNYFAELTQNLWTIAPESAKRIGHPTPFPVELVRRLLHLYAFPTARILDPFAGSGTVGVVAAAHGCTADLIEISCEYCDLAAKRILPGRDGTSREQQLSRGAKLE